MFIFRKSTGWRAVLCGFNDSFSLYRSLAVETLLNMPFASSDVFASEIGLSVLLTVIFGNESFKGAPLLFRIVSLELYLLAKLAVPRSCSLSPYPPRYSVCVVRENILFWFAPPP